MDFIRVRKWPVDKKCDAFVFFSFLFFLPIPKDRMFVQKWWSYGKKRSLRRSPFLGSTRRFRPNMVCTESCQDASQDSDHTTMIETSKHALHRKRAGLAIFLNAIFRLLFVVSRRGRRIQERRTVNATTEPAADDDKVKI